MPKVPLTMDIIKKCICPQCLVQTESKCIKEKMAKTKKMMSQEDAGMPQASDIPGMYCSTGVAACTDLDYEQMCICGSCPLWDIYSLPELEPKGYYCRDGEAK